MGFSETELKARLEAAISLIKQNDGLVAYDKIYNNMGNINYFKLVSDRTKLKNKKFLYYSYVETIVDGNTTTVKTIFRSLKTPFEIDKLLESQREQLAGKKFYNYSSLIIYDNKSSWNDAIKNYKGATVTTTGSTGTP